MMKRHECRAPPAVTDAVHVEGAESAAWIFPAVALLSLTPCFSGVFGERRGGVNRFNGLRPFARWNRGERPKPLKRLTAPRFARNTPLKQGVNERAPRMEKSKMRTHQTPRCVRSVFGA